MNFAVTEEQRQLDDSLQRLLADANDFESRRKRLRSLRPDRIALWPQFAELGVIAAAFDESHGGFAGDARTMAVVLSALGESLAVEPYLANAVIVGRILQRSTVPLATALIDETIAGQAICVLAHDAGTDPFATPSVVVTQKDEMSVLTGQMRCIRHADVAGSFLVVAAHDHSTAIYHVPCDAPGMSLETYRLMDGAGAGDIRLESVRLPTAARLAFDATAEEALHDALEWGLLGLSAEAAGIVGALNRATFSYLGTRKQFGVPLATFQALQHRAADMFISAEEIAAAVDYAIEALGGSPNAARSAAISAAKVIADSAGRRVGHEAVQMHGGMGVSDELNISHYARRLAAIRADLGSADTHRLRFASMQ
jgi:alkylation response protein AidB-like acyl-CoA dehydrogenase